MAIIDNIYNYFDSNADLHVLFIFDPMRSMFNEIEDTVLREGFRFVEFQGNWFATKYALEKEWCDEKVILYFQQAAPATREVRANFPLMDLLVANAEFKSNNYEAFMQQNRIDDAHITFVQKHISELQLEKFNRILGGYYGETFSLDVGFRGLISGYMGDSRMLSWNEILQRLFIFAHNCGEPKSLKFFASLQSHRDVLAALNSQLHSIFDAGYDENSPQKIVEAAQRLKYNLITQLFGVNNADNYKHLKVTNSVMLEQMNQLFESVKLLPARRREEWLEAFDALAADIHESEIVRVYSLDENYYYVPVAMCWEILKAIIIGKVKDASDDALDRLRLLKIKTADNPSISTVIDYAMQAALFYQKTRSLGSLILNTPDDYINRYTTDYYLLDTYYRKSIEYFLALDVDIPVRDAIDGVKSLLDKDYARIINDINIEWVRCLKERGNGFGEISTAFRQENFYETKKQSTKWVVIVSDALRYEVAKELTEQLNRSKHSASLEPAIAMLPTETKYCKPSLLPYEQMDLFDVTLGLDHTILDTTEKRTQHLCKYVHDAVCVDFEKVQGSSKEELRSLFSASLVYIFHNAIDNAGHNGYRSIIKACRDSVKEIADCVKRIHDNVTTKNIFITADHGFIYNDMTFAENDKTTITEAAAEQKTRYYLTASDSEVTNVAKFPLRYVSGIDNDIFVAVPVGTNRFKVQGADYNFVHGGAALQEVIIPVVHSTYNKQEEKRKVDITLLTQSLSIVSSRLRIQILQNEAVSADIKPREIVCNIYCNDAKVTNDTIITLDSTDADVLQN
ncbi:MAG: PglZ domain-containing protein, partial [Muribaculaceae bacterium]